MLGYNALKGELVWFLCEVALQAGIAFEHIGRMRWGGVTLTWKNVSSYYWDIHFGIVDFTSLFWWWLYLGEFTGFWGKVLKVYLSWNLSKSFLDFECEKKQYCSNILVLLALNWAVVVGECTFTMLLQAWLEVIQKLSTNSHSFSDLQFQHGINNYCWHYLINQQLMQENSGIAALHICTLLQNNFSFFEFSFLIGQFYPHFEPLQFDFIVAVIMFRSFFSLAILY